jgi:predicted amidohydrolase YtcJ
MSRASSGGGLAFHGGTVHGGLEPDRLLVSDDRVVAWPAEPGAPDAPAAPGRLAGSGELPTVVDLNGGYLGPAFSDGHSHPVLAARELLGPPIRGARSVAEILQAVRDWAAGHPEAEWIVGGSYDATLVADGLFDARVLDEAVADRPVVLRAWDYHSVWCNSLALERAGLDASTPEPAGGMIPRRDDGAPLGVLFEAGAVDLMLAHVPRPRLADDVAALARATGELASHGIAWAQEAWADPDDVPIWIAAAEQGVLSVEADLALRADPTRWPEQIDELLRLRDAIEAAPGLSCRTVKFFVDGIIENRTAEMLDDYADHCSRGVPVWGAAALRGAVGQVAGLGFDLHLHAIGDGGVRSALDAVEALRAEHPAEERGVTIAHAQLIAEADLGRFAQLGVTVCFQPLWAAADRVMTELTLPRLGAGRELQYRIGSVLASGATVSFGSDWPVTSPDVLAGIRTAVTRQTAEGDPVGGWQPTERITVEAALAAATSGVARQSRSTATRGHLEPGARADLVWLSHDPRTVPPEELGAITVLGTWSAGRRTF